MRARSTRHAPFRTGRVQNWRVESDGSVRIAWSAEGFEAIHVYARFWPSAEVHRRAQDVADVALMNRTVHDLRRGLRAQFGGGFSLQAPDEDAPDRRVAVFFDPPARDAQSGPVLKWPRGAHQRLFLILSGPSFDPAKRSRSTHASMPATLPQLSYCHSVQPRPPQLAAGTVGWSTCQWAIHSR